MIKTDVLRKLASQSNDGVIRGPAFDAADKIDAQVGHIIAQREHIAALEKRVKAARGALADIFDGEPQWPHKPKKELKWCRKRAEEAYRATGGQDNE
jgi:hypothetical protein